MYLFGNSGPGFAAGCSTWTVRGLHRLGEAPAGRTAAWPSRLRAAASLLQ